MNPKPLLALNHFTVPCSLLTCFYSFLLTALRSYFESGRVGTVLLISYLVPRLRTPQQSYGPSLGVKKGRKFELATDLTLPKAIQEQQTQNQHSTPAAFHLELFFAGVFGVNAEPRGPVGHEEGLEVATDPGADGALPVHGPGEHGAAVDVLDEAGEFGGVTVAEFAGGDGFVQELLCLLAEGAELREGDRVEVGVGEIDLEI